MGILYSSRKKRSCMTTLRLLLPRTKRDQLILMNNPVLAIPPSDYGAAFYQVPILSLVELFIFNGTLYFDTKEEQAAYCQCIAVCPKPRTDTEEDAFEKGWIAMDGFVENLGYRCILQLRRCSFRSNPLLFIRKLIENRNNMHAPLRSHVGSIIMEATKHTFLH